ncbi:hypothetical protein GCM10028808_00440 [Spirosoma migulaei]
MNYTLFTKNDLMALSKETRKQMAHALAGVIISIKGIDKIEHHHEIMGSVLIGIGVVIIGLTIYHHRLAKYIKSFDALVFLVEAIVLSIVSILYLQDGKKALPIAYIVASLAYLVAAYRSYHRDKKAISHH